LLDERGKMGLPETYEKTKPSIVAFTKKYSFFTEKELTPQNLSFDPIIGTGFVIDKNGIIATNDHIAERLIKSEPNPLSRNGECHFNAMLFNITDKGLLPIHLEIIEVFQPKRYPTKMHCAPDKPDIAFVKVKAKDLPALELDTSTLKAGIEVATAGFPMGTNALVATGKLGQISPTLQRGIISAVLPYQQTLPHAYTINVMVQGGASGSPVFLPESGKVIGVLYSSLNDYNQLSGEGVLKDIELTKEGKAVESMQIKIKAKYAVPTNISYVIPSRDISGFFSELNSGDDFTLPSDTKTLDELIASKDQEEMLPGQLPGTIWKIDLES